MCQHEQQMNCKLLQSKAMRRSYSRSPSRSRKSDRRSKPPRRRSRSNSRDYDKYRRKGDDKSRRQDRSATRSKSRPVAASSSTYQRDKTSSYRNRSRDRSYTTSSRKGSSSRERYRERKSHDRTRYRRSSSSSSISSSTSSSSSNRTSSSNSSKSSRNPSPVKASTENNEKTFVFKSMSDTCEDPTNQVSKLEELNAEEFVPQTFVSSRKVAATSAPTTSSIVIDLESQTIKVPTSESPATYEDPLFHSMFFSIDDSERMARWVKKLHLLRQSIQ